MMESLETNTPTSYAVKNSLDTSGQGYEEYRTFLMHTIWLTESNSLSRWFEWFLTVRTYTVITTGATPKASVYPYEITGPPCKSCVMSITHTGSIAFFEERDRNALNFPNTSPMVFLSDCDWDTPRNDLAFQSLAGGVCFAITLNDVNSLRTFKLEKLSYGYRGSDGVTRAIDHKYLYKQLDTGGNETSTFFDYARWNVTKKALHIRLKVLVLGQVTRLQYQAQIRLCQLQSGTYNPALPCVAVTPANGGTDAADLNQGGGRRMLSEEGPSNRRWLQNKNKQVIQQYTTESTNDGPSQGIMGSSKDESSPAGAIVGGVVVLGALGTVGYLFMAKKACFAAKAAGGQVPTNPPQTGV